MADDNTRTDRFLAFFTASQRQLYAYIRAQVRGPSDADDILQETSAVLRRKFDEFAQTTSFMRWACRVARLEVLNYEHNRHRAVPVFSDVVREKIADAMLGLAEAFDARHEALNDCMKKLTRQDQKIVADRYQLNASVAEIAKKRGRSESSIYKSLSRIHDALFDCIERSAHQEESESPK